MEGITEAARAETWVVDLVGRCNALIADPAYPAAARAIATNFLALGDADKALGSVFKDAGRYITAMSVALLHGAGGLTLPRLKEICAASGFLSSGRARTLVQFLLHLGYIEAVPVRGNLVSYMPTPAFFAAWRSHVRAGLDAAARVEPRLTGLIARLDDARVLEMFLQIQGQGLHALARVTDQTSIIQQLFLHRYGGMQILWTLLAAGDDDMFPSDRPIKIMLGPTARRFDVSHVHIRRLLTDAIAADLLSSDTRGTVMFRPGTRDFLQFQYAAQLIALIDSGMATLDAI